MFGAVIGDIVGSRFEFHNHKSKNFRLFDRANGSRFTDDTVMTLAIAQSLLDTLSNPHQSSLQVLADTAVSRMREFGIKYLNVGYGHKFKAWITSPNPAPYGSFGNGSAMRISPVGLAARDVPEAKSLAKAVTEITHNHPEGLKAAEAVAVAMVLAKAGCSLKEIKDYVTVHYYAIDFTLDEIRPTYHFTSSAKNSVPQAFEAFFESIDFEDAIRNAVSIGGDSDTIAAIVGGLAEAYYGVPTGLAKEAEKFLDNEQKRIVREFEHLMDK